MEVPKDNSFFHSNEFLKDPGKELHSHASISEKNCKAIELHKEDTLSIIKNILESQKKQDHTFLQLKIDNVKCIYSNHKQKQQVYSLTGAIQKKKKTVENLEKELKGLETKCESLKDEIENEEQENQLSAELLHKAVKYFTTNFQYMIEEIPNRGEKYNIKITFIIEGKLSKYPIHFVFDNKIDTLIDFNGGALLTKQQHEILFQRFKETNNFLALFSTLREAAVRKHS